MKLLNEARELSTYLTSVFVSLDTFFSICRTRLKTLAVVDFIGPFLVNHFNVYVRFEFVTIRFQHTSPVSMLKKQKINIQSTCSSIFHAIFLKKSDTINHKTKYVLKAKWVIDWTTIYLGPLRSLSFAQIPMCCST